MNPGQRIILASFAAAVAGIAAPSAALADSELVVAAKETLVMVEPRAARLKLVNLPALEFGLRAAYRCKGEPVSLTLSISDTFTSLDAEALQEQRAAEATLRVPARQIAMAASSNFCVAGDAESAAELLVDGFATAHASLRCISEERESMHHASAPLRVRLSCARPAGEDQEPSEPVADR